MNSVLEVNFDGLVGPTHVYAGLSHGNVASMSHRGRRSRPRAAALQGLAKMKALADLGLPQAVLPPHPRPSLATLRAFGFSGSDALVLRDAARSAPALLAACSSASTMWVANAATVTPSRDARDGRVHFTPANLASKFHRSLESRQTGRALGRIFHDPRFFDIHDPIPGGGGLGDEGAANHTRLASTHGQPGLHLYVYGHQAFGATANRSGPRRFASRQALEASEAVARQHGLTGASTCYWQQNPDAIDAGVFHNDVICVGNENLLLFHEQAFIQPERSMHRLQAQFRRRSEGGRLACVMVPKSRVPLRTAVRTYLFNSQIVTLPAGGMLMLAPMECAEDRRVSRYLRDLLESGTTPLVEVRFVDLRESMRNGGGPACLRLRVVLTAAERAALPPGIWINDQTYPRLARWIERWYPESLQPGDLADPHLHDQHHRALARLGALLGLPGLYET